MDGILARFPFRAEAAYRFAQANRKRRNGFEALGSGLRQSSVALAPYFGKKEFRVSQNAGERIIQFVAQHFAEILAIHVCEHISSSCFKQFSAGMECLGFALGLAQPPLNEPESHGQATARTHYVIRAARGYQAGEFRLVFRVADHHDWRKGGQRGDSYIQTSRAFVQIAGLQRHGRLREQNYGRRGVLDDAARGVHRAHRSDLPALIDGFKFVARGGAQRRVIANQKNRVFPGCHITLPLFDLANGLMSFFGSRKVSSARELAIQKTKYFRCQLLDAERFGHVRHAVSLQKFLGLLGNHVASHK
jgi:hypothetical protein